jgi:hypothetical protein
MMQMDFMRKHRALLLEFMDVPTDEIPRWMERRIDREIHVLAHFMYLCHHTAQFLQPYVQHQARLRNIHREHIAPGDL